MSDAKITELTELTDPTGEDLLAVVDDVAGTPIIKKTTIQKIADLFASLTQTLTNKTLTTPVINGLITGTFGGYYNSVSSQAIINGGFTVNQRGYVSSATLASGSYGHDRWKAGAGGGDYTFTQLASSTQITIEAGKTLIQVIEDKNVVGGTYTLSWTGTAQARAGVDSATPSGGYADSPLTISAQTAGTVMSVEFDDGTLGQVQLNSGSVALPFQPKSFAQELADCLRYIEVINFSQRETIGIAFFTDSNSFQCPLTYKVRKRAIPTIILPTTAPDSAFSISSADGAASFVDNSTLTTTRIGLNGCVIAGDAMSAIYATNDVGNMDIRSANGLIIISAEL